MDKLNKLALIIMILYLTGCARQGSYYPINLIRKEGTGAKIEEFLEQFPQKKAHWGMLVQNERGDTLYSYNPDKLFVPASTLKVITAAMAWKMLGSEYRLPTFIGYNGFTNNNILFGDLVITGTGDPTLNSRHWRDPAEVFSSWADSLRRYGIDEIRGDIIGNDDLFEEVRLGSGWAWDDLSFPFSAEFGPLMANNSTAEISVIPPQSGKGEIQWLDNLPFSYLDYKNEITLCDSLKCRIHARRMPGKNKVRLYGNLQPNAEEQHKSVTVSNPTLYYVKLLKSELENNGIIISGDARDIDDLKKKPEEIIPIFTSESPPLKQIISQFLQDSNNQAGEALVRTVAWQEYGYGDFSNGKLIVEVMLENCVVSMHDYRYRDSCGLSRYNLLSPSALNKLLIYMQDEPGWKECLPQPGKTGTLEKRLSEYEGSLFAKTGSMSGINCMSGYLYINGKKLIFTIMVNNYSNSGKASDQIDRIIRILNKKSISY